METKSQVQIDKGRLSDWGKTSADYARHRPGPPQSFYEKLAVLGVGLPNQKILDLGTGTGFLPLEFAKRGAHVVGVDVSAGQISEAKRLASAARLEIDYKVAPAEKTGLPSHAYDVVTANQCWLYFDHDRTLSEVTRLLRPGGLLVISHFSWLPVLSLVAQRSEELILKFNPDWTGGNWSGYVPPCYPQVLDRHYVQTGMFQYDEDVPFTRDSWRGRIRACRGVGAAMSGDEVEAFDEQHEHLLNETIEPDFFVKHRIFAHIMSPTAP